MCATRRVLCAVALGLLLAVPVHAQVTTADLVGRVTDTSGGVLPGATVTLTNEGTRDVRVAATGDGGDYVFNLLPIGSYTVAVTLQGFGSQSTKVTLSAGDRVRFDTKLQVGLVAETITVTAASPLLQTDTATLSALVTEKAVQDLPVNGRNFVRLVQLAPGAHEGLPNSLASGTRPDDRRQTSAISINGALDNQNNQLIDGMDNNERAIGTIGVKPSIDAIAEVKVQTSNYTAETGRTAGGVVNILTKSGTNSFRGSAFEFARNDRFDAKNFFAATKPVLSQHQYGGSLGGPLRADRTFFFADYEGFQQTQGVTNVITVPTARMRNGDFGELSVAIHDPLAARAPFPNNQIPANRFDPIAMKYMALYPAPTSGGLANNYAEHHRAHAGQLDGRRAHRPPVQRQHVDVRALLLQQRRHVHAVGLPADRGRHRAGLRRRPGISGTEHHQGAWRPGQLRARPFGLADLRIQGRLPQGRHPVVAAQLRIEPEPAVRHPWRECR